MEMLEKTKCAHQRNLTRLETTITSLLQQQTTDSKHFSKLEFVLAHYKEIRSSFYDVVNQMLIVVQKTDKQYDTLETSLMKELDQVDEVAFNTEAEIRNLKTQFPESFMEPESIRPELQKINIPTFDGNIVNFNSFRRLFENLVHYNNELTNVQKLVYLKQALTGSAAELIRDFDLEDKSYSDAWSYFIFRYDNPKGVVQNLFKQLTSLRIIKSDTEIRKLIDQVDVIMQGLKAAGQSVDETFSKFVAFLVATRLDPNTVKLWEDSISSMRTHPNYKQLQQFLQTRSFNAEERIVT